MSRGGYRKGAGRKREYQEPVQKILLGLPQSVLQKLDDYAQEHNLSRPKAIALLLEQMTGKPVPEKPMPETKPAHRQELLSELKALKESLESGKVRKKNG